MPLRENLGIFCPTCNATIVALIQHQDGKRLLAYPCEHEVGTGKVDDAEVIRYQRRIDDERQLMENAEGDERDGD